MNGGVRKSPPMHGDFNDATINDFTCSLTNHNVRWLTIYSDGMLHLANTDLFAMPEPGVVWNEIQARCGRRFHNDLTVSLKNEPV